MSPYPPPLDQLLALGGESVRTSGWTNYMEFGLTAGQVPELIRMATDETLLWAEDGSPELWAPVHAWRALGQLRAESAIEPLAGLLTKLDDDDGVLEDLPIVFALIGGAAIPAMAGILADATVEIWPRLAAARALKKTAERYPRTRAEVVALLSGRLAKWYRNDEGLNGFLISYLVDLRATEAAPLISQAFAAGRVDLLVCGDWEDVQIELGLLAERRTPPPRLRPLPPTVSEGIETGGDTGKRTKPSSKAKRRMARQSRKRNRRRK